MISVSRLRVFEEETMFEEETNQFEGLISEVPPRNS